MKQKAGQKKAEEQEKAQKKVSKTLEETEALRSEKNNHQLIKNLVGEAKETAPKSSTQEEKGTLEKE